MSIRTALMMPAGSDRKAFSVPMPRVRTLALRAWCVATLTSVGVLSVALSGCTGADVGVTVAPLGAQAVDTSGQIDGNSSGIQPLCLADSDCTPLADTPCAQAVCEPSSHRCVVLPKPDLTSCTGSSCDVSACLGGQCVAIAHKSSANCSDGNPCTDDSCVDKLGCVHVPSDAAACSDGNPCTADDHCLQGTCVSGTNQCPCTTDGDCSGWQGQDACLAPLLCAVGGCVPDPSAATPCDDKNACTTDSCNPKTGACVHTAVAEGAVCDDNNLCTVGDRCTQGGCAGAGTLPCAINGQGCPMQCDPQAGCVPDPASVTPCDDGNPCTAGDACHSGSCAGAPICECKADLDCVGKAIAPACMGKPVCSAGVCVIDADLAQPCTETAGAFTGCALTECTPQGCVAKAKPIAGPCDDGNACTFGDICNAQGLCSGVTAVSCDDGNACTLDNCTEVNAGCVHTLDLVQNGKACDDGNPCTTGETCQSAKCLSSKPSCDDGNPCTADLCDSAGQGACLHKTYPDGSGCEDSDPCTLGGTCQAGNCAFALVQACDDWNPCTADSCDPAGGCLHDPPKANTPTTCDDGDSCTTGDTCFAGVCKGKGGACQCQQDSDCVAFEDGNACNGTLICQDHACAIDLSTVVTCTQSDNPCVTVQCQALTGICSEVPLLKDVTQTAPACDDGDACTLGDACGITGACLPGKPSVCSDGQDCTQDLCDSLLGCVYPPWDATAGVPCDDGNACTFGDVCSAGACKGGLYACQCQTTQDCMAFDDGNACNGGLICQAGACVSDSKDVTCTASDNPCIIVACDPKSGQCQDNALVDGSGCDKPGTCATGGSCQGGVCIGAKLNGCDDSNPCTQDVCLPSGCTHTAALASPCNDGNDCTTGEKCDANGQCGGGQNSCSCVVDKDCPNDGNQCNGVYACVAGTCQPKAGSVVVCDATKNNACQTNTCQVATGACAMAYAATAAVCDDGTACTVGDSCKDGVCLPGVITSCDDGNVCTDDGCNPALGCYHNLSVAACDDGNPCTSADVCSGGKCVGTGSCACQVTADCKDDGNLCNGTPVCTAGQCVVDASTIIVCDPNQKTACTVPLCDAPSGKCLPSPVPDATVCDDGSACTSVDQCKAGVCAGIALNCDDKNVCTTDSCDSVKGCQNLPNNGPCDDGNACTSGDACAAGVCKAGIVTCSACLTTADCKDDGDLCNGTPICQAGQCVNNPATVVTCPAGDACSANVCQPSTGQCKKAAANDGAVCDDGSACTTSSACFGGSCVGANALNCDDKNACTTDSCDAKVGCLHAPNFGPCDDGNPCTVADACGADSQCHGGTNKCACQTDADCKDDGNACNGVLICQANQCVVKVGSVITCDATKDTACAANTCQPATGQCTFVSQADGTACSDGKLCTTGDACKAGSCVGSSLACDDGNPCTDDSCVEPKGCAHINNAASCTDGNACTTGDACSAGVCKAGANSCQCSLNSDCAKFEDGNACNGTLVCQANTCVVDAKTIVTCAPSTNPCTTATCDAKSGACLAIAVADATPCGGAALCGGSGTCAAGVCKGANGCADDGNPCTTASCDGAGICSQQPSSGACSDGNNCTMGDACSGGKCVGGANQCNCKVNADCKKWDDGNLCNGIYACVAGQCQPDPTTVINCPAAADSCQLSACDPSQGLCETANQPDGTACDDNNACTSAGQCFAGSCLVKSISCDDGNSCTTDSCDPVAGCKHANLLSQCNDGNPCTQFDVCLNGKCTGIPINNCNCGTDADCASKEDGNACNGTLSCQGGKCNIKPGSVITCDASKNTDCQVNACQPATGACVLSAAPAGKSCSDSSACTGGDVCSMGKCIGVTLDCQDNQACTLDSCNPATGCQHVANNAACNDNDACTLDVCDVLGGCIHQAQSGGACDDGNPCTSGETCGLGPAGVKCFGGTATNCNDNNICTTDSCDQVLGCVHGAVANCCTSAAQCDDGQSCTLDTCDATSGKCSHTTPKGTCCSDSDCTPANVCEIAYCQANVCAAKGSGDPNCCSTNSDCNDKNACTADSCDAIKHQCLFVATGDPTCCNVPADCDDGNSCTIDACTASKCTHSNGGTCTDGNPCTTDACVAGACSIVLKSCDDGLACNTDSCDSASGNCVHTVAPGWSLNFDDGTTGGLQFQSVNPQAAWTVDKAQTVSAPYSLYVGKVSAVGLHTYNVGPNAATATLPVVAIPAGVGKATFTFDLYFDRDPAEAAGCNGTNDSVSVLVGNTIIQQTCANTGGFKTITVDLSAQAGKSVQLFLTFIANLTQNNGQGAWFDNLNVQWTCP